MKVSIGEAPATGGFASGLRLHQSSGSAALALAASGQTAPSSIHFLKSPICSALNRLPFGGIIMSSSSPATNFTNGLSALLPGTMFGA